nr:hypothetical protein HK105_007962 [Polyrhizophydium stewartii]
MDLGWCIQCGKHIDAAFLYCSQACQFSDFMLDVPASPLGAAAADPLAGPSADALLLDSLDMAPLPAGHALRPLSISPPAAAASLAAASPPPAASPPSASAAAAAAAAAQQAAFPRLARRANPRRRSLRPRERVAAFVPAAQNDHDTEPVA